MFSVFYLVKYVSIGGPQKINSADPLENPTLQLYTYVMWIS